MQRFWFFPPFVLACAAMMAPHPGYAQAPVACPPSQNRIIQVCDTDLWQFDSDSVQAYLTAHSLAATDSTAMLGQVLAGPIEHLNQGTEAVAVGAG